jgi:prohibitin 2
MNLLAIPKDPVIPKVDKLRLAAQHYDCVLCGKDKRFTVGAHCDEQEFGKGVGLIVLKLCWPFYSVPTGSRGVVTQFGKIVGIEGEGLAVLPPWQKLSNFSIRAEQADIEKAEGSTSDTQPVHVSMTVRYSIATDKVSEVFEKYSHDGNLSSYVQTATQEIFKAVTARYTAPD